MRYSISDDEGLTWSPPAQVPTQAGNSVMDGAGGDLASVIAFGDSVGIAWGDHDELPAVANDGYYFSVIDAGDDPATAANWSPDPKLPTLLPSASESADNYLNLKTTSDGTVYMVAKTGKDTAECATNKQVPLIGFFRRTTAGAWCVHLVGTVGDCNTRPHLAVSEKLDTARVFLTSPFGSGGSIYEKSAPLSGPDAFVFRGTADQTIQRGAPFIRSATRRGSTIRPPRSRPSRPRAASPCSRTTCSTRPPATRSSISTTRCRSPRVTRPRRPARQRSPLGPPSRRRRRSPSAFPRPTPGAG